MNIRQRILIATLAAAVPATPTHAQPKFVFLDQDPDWDVTNAHGVSADGSVVVGGVYKKGVGDIAFMWTKATGLVSLGDQDGVAYGVSADGTVIVGRLGSQLGDTEAFRWTAKTGIVGLGDFPGGKSRSAAYGVSADGSTIVGYGHDVDGIEAFAWTERSGMVGLGDLPGGISSSVARAVSADGSVIVGDSQSAAGNEAFRWTTRTGMVVLEDIPAGSTRSVAQAVTSDGGIAVGSGEPGYGTGGEACLWDQSGHVRRLGGGWDSCAYGVSGDGSLVVGKRSPKNFYAMIWRPFNPPQELRDYLINLGTPGLEKVELWEANAISADGRTIVGWSNNNGWIVTLPEHCPVDCNFSYTLDVDDFICFQMYFSLGDKHADCDGSGALEFDDFICFQTAFAAGCP